MNFRQLFFISLIILLTACEAEEFFPDENVIRDDKLIGTWKLVNYESDNLTVFTIDGYYSSTMLIDAPTYRGFTDLSMLWHNVKLPTEFELGDIYVADDYKHWTKRRYEGYMSYKLSEYYDTLYFPNSLESSGYDVYVRNKFDLLFDGNIWIGIDSTSN